MADRGPLYLGLARRGSGWRAWIGALAMAVAGAAAAEVFCHDEHAADQRCAVCQLPHQPAADPPGSAQIGFGDVAEPIEQPAHGHWIASGHFRRLPARGPPA
ncbi:MAG: hypothetical protein OXQ28_09360 [Acidobacteriota bacterium]|nr:hypothetical protein [Acidobacteriota bacterium]